MATWWPLTFRTWPGWLLIPTTIIMGFLAGSVWGFIPGVLKARLKVNEILSTVMMNAIAIQLMNLLIRSVLIDPAGVEAGTYLAQSERLPTQVWLVRLVPQTLLNAGAILAVILAFVVYIFLWRTTIGYRIRAVGLNPDASRYAGINVPFYQALSLTLAGGFAGSGRSCGSSGCAASSAGRDHQRIWFLRYCCRIVRRTASTWDNSSFDFIWRPAGRCRQNAARRSGSLFIDRCHSRFGCVICGRFVHLDKTLGCPPKNCRSERSRGIIMTEITTLGIIIGILNLRSAVGNTLFVCRNRRSFRSIFRGGQPGC